MNTSPPPDARVIYFDVGSVWKDENGFCHIRLVGGTNKQLGVDEVKEMAVAVFDICGGEKHKHLIDARGTYGPVMPGAREEIRSNEQLNACRSAAAMIVNSMANRLMIAFFIQFNKPPYPYRVFDDEDDAVKWLLSL